MTLFAFEDPGRIPSSLKVKEHSLDYYGAPQKRSRKHLTGVYGTNSKDAALFLAASYADAHRKMPFLIDVWAHLPNFHATRSQITREVVQSSHWMHAERLSSSLKEEIHQKALKWLIKERGPGAHAKAIDQSVPSIMLDHPEFALKLLDEDPDLGMLVHPIYAKFDMAQPKTPFWAATLHLDRVQIVAAEVRHRPDIQVVI